MAASPDDRVLDILVADIAVDQRPEVLVLLGISTEPLHFPCFLAALG